MPFKGIIASDKLDFMEEYVLVQTDLFGRIPEVIVDIHEMRHRDKDTSITLFVNTLEQQGVMYRVEKLEVADLIMPSGYAVERKTVKDFCQSLFGTREGRLRLMEQIEALIRTYEHPVLLIEGGLAVRPDPIRKAIYVQIRRNRVGKRLWNVLEEEIKIHPNQYEGAINEIQNRGIEVIKSYDAYHGSLILLGMFNKAKEIAKKRKSTRYPIVRSKPKLKTIRDRQLFFLSGLPGISISRAQKILKTYKTPYNAVLKVRRWDIDVEGIGTKTLDQVLKVLFAEYNEKDQNKEKN